MDAIGPNFLLHINDHLLDSVTDTSYTSGEVGIYGESLDNPTVHIHYDTFTIRALQLDLSCTIDEGGTVYVRGGPSKTTPQIAVLSSGDAVQALGISSNQWIQIVVEGSNEPGWVSWSDPNIRRVMSCTPSVDLFPVVTP